MITPRYLAAIASFMILPYSRSDSLFEAFQNPEAITRPFVRWWWNGGRVDTKEIERELDVMKAAGIGGVEINTIGMPTEACTESLQTHPAVSWLSPEWNHLVRFAAEAARQRGMSTDLIVGSGWPFGGRFLEPEHQTQKVRLIKKMIQGPRQLSFSSEELTQLEPDPKPKNDLEDVPEPTRTELLFARVIQKNHPTEAFTPGNDLVSSPNGDGRYTLDLPAGDFTLYVGTLLTGFEHVKLGAPGADGPVVNHFDAEAVGTYLNRMSAALAPALNGNMGSELRAMFVDSLELDCANWTTDLTSEFKKRRGYDLLPYLPFVLEANKLDPGSSFDSTVRRARYDFEKTLVELFDERFISTYLRWTDQNHLKARIQAYGRETHPLHGSMRAQLPEGESWLWLDKFHPERIKPESTVVNKYVSSAANLTGQKIRSFEAMTNTVPVFRETLQDFKAGTDATFLAGLNHPIIHGYNYTPLDAGFPGWVRFGNYLNERTPWWPYFKSYSDYVARIGTVMRASETPTRVAVLAPRADEWANHGRLYQPFPEIADPWYQFLLIDAIQKVGYNADYISEKILTEGKKTNGKLTYGPCAYDLIILEEFSSLEPEAAEALAEFVASGGHLAILGDLPARSPGLLEARLNDQRVAHASARIRQEGDNRLNFVAPPTAERISTENGDAEILLGVANALLRPSGLTPDVIFKHPSATISQLYQRDSSHSIYFIANSDSQASARVVVSFPSAKGKPFLWNPENGTREALRLGPENQIDIDLEPVGSALIVFSENMLPLTSEDLPKPRSEREVLSVPGPWKVILAPAGSDMKISREFPKLVDFSQQDKDDTLKYFGGAAFYEIEFEGTELAEAVLDLGEVRDTSEVTLNGVALGNRWSGRHRYSVAGNLHAGHNVLRIKVTTVLANLMKHKNEDATAQRWASWAPPIAAGLVGPVRILVSDF